MNKVTYSNPCIRCGTERVVVKTWTEKVGGSIITNSKSACPNAACQRAVNSENKKQRDKHTAMRVRSEERAAGRKAAKMAERAAKIRA